MPHVLSLASQLISLPSVTPSDQGCQKILIDRLKKIGFEITALDSNGVSNFYAQRGPQKKLFAFLGHTDVVPPGDISRWISPTFQATIRDGKLYGRGAADMKSALAAMVVAAERFIEKNPDHANGIAFLVTSDEEGDAVHGTAKIVDYLRTQNIHIDYALVGEASSQKKLGDGIKVGRRGSLHGELIVQGKQGHIAYPQLADNPIHRSFQALDALTKTEWDKGNALFSPTSFQIYHIHADTGAANIIPGTLTARFNFRHCPDSTAESLQSRVEAILKAHHLDYSIKWNHSSKPFYSKPGRLTEICTNVIQEICHLATMPNTTGGTSDGRFLAPTGAEIVELGVINESAHHVNECVALEDLEKLAILYERILENLAK